MKVNSTFLLMIFSFCFLFFQSCSEDDSELEEDNSTACADFENEYSDVITSLTAYSQNPSLQNCENYKSALESFYNEFKDCPLWGEEYNEALDEIQTIDCSEQN